MRTRILETEELHVLAEVEGGPFFQRPDVVAKLGDAQVVVLEREDTAEIVAYWPIWAAIHLEPLWITPAARGNATVGKLLVEAMRGALAAARIDTAFAIIGHGDLVTHLPMAARLGFQRVPGDLFFLGGAEHDGSSGDSGDLPGGAALPQPEAEPAHQPGARRGDDGPPEFGG